MPPMRQAVTDFSSSDFVTEGRCAAGAYREKYAGQTGETT